MASLNPRAQFLTRLQQKRQSQGTKPILLGYLPPCLQLVLGNIISKVAFLSLLHIVELLWCFSSVTRD